MVDRLYDENLYQFEAPQRSYWEATAGNSPLASPALAANEYCDVAVIGGGYTGLSAALHLSRDYGIDVRVLDAGHIGWGASGRNGGFCCVGGTAVHRQDLAKMVGLEQTQEYYRAQVDAVELVRKLGVEEEIDFLPQGDCELEVAHTAKAFERIKSEHQFITRQLGLSSRLYGADEFRERFYNSTEVFGALTSEPAFGLHPLRFCRGLAAAAQRRGATLHSYSEVTGWEKTDDGYHRLQTVGGSLRARKVIFATNGFMPETLHPDFYARSLPVISAIIVTRPLSRDEQAAHQWVTDNPAANSRRILNYFRRLPDDRFLFGGRGHSTGHPRGELATYRQLRTMLGQLWPAWADVEIDYQWHGLICTTGTLRPTIGQLESDSSIYYGFGYHGNGVNTAPWAGQQLAEMIGTGSNAKLPLSVRGLSRRYPVAKMRLKYLRLLIALSAWLDKRG